MKPPILLLGATLLFWGWQTGLPWVGLGLGVLVELATVVKARWDFSDEDFERIWTLCSFLLLAMVVFAFTQNDGLSTFSHWFDAPANGDQRRASLTAARTASNVLRWLPMVFFPFLLAQLYSTRETIPLATISHILQRRWKMAQRLGQKIPPSRGFHVGYPYFCMTLLAASFHSSEDNSYFWGFCVLLAWVLGALRSRRYSLAVWVAIIVVAGVAGYFGQRGITQVQRYIVSLNAQWLARWMRRSEDPFESRTAIGRVGQIKNSSAIAVRLTPHSPKAVPLYLREATYRLYDRQTWYAGSSRDDFSSVSEVPLSATNQPYWPLIPDKRTSAAVQISCYLDGSENGITAGLLPLPSGTARLEKCPIFSMKINSAGAVLAQGPGLVIFDAHFGPGVTFDSLPGTNARRDSQRAGRTNDTQQVAPLANEPAAGPPNEATGEGRRARFRRIVNEDLFVDAAETNALNAVLTELHLTNGTPARAATARLAAFFNDKFSYSMWQGFQKPGDASITPLGRFLLQTRSGHCEYFATATVHLLRQLGIPARYATGYSVHEQSGADYVVRFSDAHAWTLVWNDARKIWEDFDTTPASWVEIERSGFSPFRWLGDIWSRFKYELAKFRYGQSNVRKYLLWIIVPGLALLLYQIVFRRGRKRQRLRQQDEQFFASWPGLDSDFYRLEKHLASRGIIRGEAEPLGDWLQRVLETHDLEKLRAPLEEVLRLHYRHRFDPIGLNAGDREALRRETSRCLEAVTALRAPAPT